MKIGIIGLGKMGEALVTGLRSSKEGASFAIRATTRSRESAADAARRLKLDCDTDNAKLVASADVLVLCVKPHQAQALLEPIASKIGPQHLLISVCASLTTAQVAQWSGGRA